MPRYFLHGGRGDKPNFPPLDCWVRCALRVMTRRLVLCPLSIEDNKSQKIYNIKYNISLSLTYSIFLSISLLVCPSLSPSLFLCHCLSLSLSVVSLTSFSAFLSFSLALPETHIPRSLLIIPCVNILFRNLDNKPKLRSR